MLLASELEESGRLIERERDAASLDAHLDPRPERFVGGGLRERADPRGVLPRSGAPSTERQGQSSDTAAPIAVHS